MTCARQSRRRLIRSVCSACATCCSCWRIHAINEIRTFVAIRLDETVRAALGAAIEGLRRVARDVAWVAPENLHLTLKFLGQVREARTAELVAAIAQATSGFAAFEATVAGLGAFPTPTRPRVIWAGVGRGADALVGLAGRVDEALAALGFEREPRPFSPHATLGRVRTPRRDPALRSEEHTSELQSQSNLVCRLLLEKKKNTCRHAIL